MARCPIGFDDMTHVESFIIEMYGRSDKVNGNADGKYKQVDTDIQPAN